MRFDMIFLSLICIGAGIFSVAASLRAPGRRAALEALGGCLLVIGLAVIGAGLPLFR